MIARKRILAAILSLFMIFGLFGISLPVIAEATEAPVITTNLIKEFETVPKDGELILSVQVENATSYQWQSCTAKSFKKNVTDIQNANDYTISVDTSVVQNLYYRLKASNDAGDTFSNVAYVQVLPESMNGWALETDFSSVSGKTLAFCTNQNGITAKLNGPDANLSVTLTFKNSGDNASASYKNGSDSVKGSTTVTHYADTCITGNHTVYYTAQVTVNKVKYTFESDHYSYVVSNPPQMQSLLPADQSRIIDKLSNSTSYLHYIILDQNYEAIKNDARNKTIHILLPATVQDNDTVKISFVLNLEKVTYSGTYNGPIIFESGSIADNAENPLTEKTIQLVDGEASFSYNTQTGKSPTQFTLAFTTNPLAFFTGDTITGIQSDKGLWENNNKPISGYKAYLVLPYGETAANVTFTFAKDIGLGGYTVDGGEMLSIVNDTATAALSSSTQGIAHTIQPTTANGKAAGKPYEITLVSQRFTGLPNRVTDYLCVGSQYTNQLFSYGGKALMSTVGSNYDANLNDPCGPVSLGNFGGYIIYQYDEAIIDNSKNPYGIDFIIYGNSVMQNANFAEPGQVWVSEDGNQWYALAGSLHYDDETLWNYSMTYTPIGATTTESGKQTGWNDGERSGILNYGYPAEKNYAWHTWTSAEASKSMTMTGIYLGQSGGSDENNNTLPPFPHFGYADVGAKGPEQNTAGNPYLGPVIRGGVETSDITDGMDLAWAVDAEGKPVTFENGIHFIKVVTATFIENGDIGEKSTEINMVRVAQPADAAVGKTDAPTKITVDGAEVALVAGQNVYDDVPIKGSFDVQVSAGENANIYINSQRGVSAEFDAMPEHGIVRVIVQEGEKEPWIAYLNLTETTTEPAATATEALISAIGTVTAGSGDAINAARAAYDALSDEAKTSVTNYATLTAAEAAYADLTAAAATDALIDAIGEVSLESAASITAAQDAYNALTDAQKALVTKLDTLTAAKAAYDTLAAAAEQEAIDAAAAKGVTDKIAALGTVTLQSESEITAARSAYNALTDTQKALVTNLDTLTAAEAALEELKNPTATLTLNANGGTVNGKATDSVGFKANNDGQALPTPEGTANLRFVGWEYGQKLYTTYVHGVLPDGATLTAVWEDTTTVTPSQNNITVSFRLIGSSKSDADIDLADGDYHGAEYQTWIATANYTLPEGSKAIDLIDLALQRAGLTTSNPGWNYIEGIYAPATLGGQEMREFTNGNRSGWMYTLNGVHANNGVAQQTLANGDAVILHYVDDYAYEVADWDRLGGVGYPALGDSTYHNAWLAAPDVNPNAPDYSGGVPSGNTDSDKKDETKTDATATVADNGEVVLAPEVTDGEAKAEVSAETVVEALKESKDANVLTVTVDTTDADKVEATLDADAVKAAAEADVDLHVETEVGTVKVDSDTLVELAEDGKDIAVTVTTNEDGTTTIDVTADGESVDAKVKVELPAAEDNQVLVIVDADGKETVIKKSLVEGDKVYAEIPAGATVKVVEADGVEFGDVADSAWYADAVEFVASHELFQGTNNGFEPETTMNRAMLAMVLYRLEDATATGNSNFPDVSSDAWYAEAVAWASETGIVNGTDKGFEPNAPVTREQIATMLYRYANVIGLDTGTRGELSFFPDGGETSSWAQDAMAWAVSVGLFQGDDTGALNPKGDATRAQVATLFERMIGLIVK